MFVCTNSTFPRWWILLRRRAYEANKPMLILVYTYVDYVRRGCSATCRCNQTAAPCWVGHQAATQHLIDYATLQLKIVCTTMNSTRTALGNQPRRTTTKNRTTDVDALPRSLTSTRKSFSLSTMYGWRYSQHRNGGTTRRCCDTTVRVAKKFQQLRNYAIIRNGRTRV